MLQEQEQRILGYFIEEAKDHLNTIEQGLLNLQDTLQDSETVNEVFRAAHSIKGGAAMLGLDSIQKISHHLEDYFKVLKECPEVEVDQKLESLFLALFDTLKELVEELQHSLCLTDSVVTNLMSKVEPVFAEFNQHIALLVNQAGGNMQPEAVSTQQFSGSVPVTFAVPQSSYVTVEKTDSLPVFQNQVMQTLREMLQLFKQSETRESRQQLQKCSQQLVQLGEQLKLPRWCALCQTASGAIANADNAYRTLAPIVIKEIKQSHELVLAAREAEIKTSQQLQALSVRNLLKQQK